jgi:DNA-binding SARP family transcriptional activator
VVLGTGGTLRLRDDIAVDVDAQKRLSRQVLLGTVGTVRIDQVCVGLEGELLPGWYDEWVLYERELLQELRQRALEVVAQSLMEERRYAAATEAALAALRDDPLRATAQRVLINVYLAEGNQAKAVEQFRRFRELSKSRLGVEPAFQLVNVRGGSSGGNRLAVIPADTR